MSCSIAVTAGDGRGFTKRCILADWCLQSNARLASSGTPRRLGGPSCSRRSCRSRSTAVIATTVSTFSCRSTYFRIFGCSLNERTSQTPRTQQPRQQCATTVLLCRTNLAVEPHPSLSPQPCLFLHCFILFFFFLQGTPLRTAPAKGRAIPPAPSLFLPCLGII